MKEEGKEEAEWSERGEQGARESRRSAGEKKRRVSVMRPLRLATT